MKKLEYALLFLFLFTIGWSCRTVVNDRPSEPTIAVRPAQPNPGYIWINGQWYRSGNSYKYRQGYWRAPRAGRNWVDGHWVHGRRGWYWKKGHWN